MKTDARGETTFSPTLREFLEDVEVRLINEGHEVFFAPRIEQFGARVRPAKICTPFDFLELVQSDVIVAVVGRSYGVHCELGWASALSIPIILLEDDTLTTPLIEGMGTIASTVHLRFEGGFPPPSSTRAELLDELCAALVKTPMRRRLRGRVGVVSTSFGFGPVSKAVTVTQALREQLPTLTFEFFGHGIAYEYAISCNAFDRVFDLDIDDPETVDGLMAHLAKYVCVVNVLNFEVMKRWRREQMPPLYWIDSLAWMWKSLPDGISNARRCFLQEYRLSKRCLEAWENTTTTTVVGPIHRAPINGRNGANGQRTLLVNLSGCANPFAPVALYQKYAEVLVRAILESAQEYDRVDICCSSAIASYLNGSLLAGTSFHAEHVPNDVFLARLAGSERVLTSPGITATMEACALGCDVRFLLPQNYSQALMGEDYHRRFGPEVAISLGEFGSDFAVSLSMPEEEGVRLVCESLDHILNVESPKLSRRLQELVTKPKRATTAVELYSTTERKSGQATVAELVLQDMVASNPELVPSTAFHSFT